MLLHSLQIVPQPETWHNLEVVHENLGQLDLAGRTRYEQQLALQNQQREQRTDQTGGGLVRWVNPQTLANQSRVGRRLGVPVRNVKQSNSRQPAARPASLMRGKQAQTPWHGMRRQ